MGFLTRLFGGGKEDPVKQVADELQHTHDLQKVIELLNGLNGQGRKGLWTTIAVWDMPPKKIGKIEMIGDEEVIYDGMARLFVPYLDEYPVRSIETYDSIDKAMGRLFDCICFDHMLLCAKYGETAYNQLILYVM